MTVGLLLQALLASAQLTKQYFVHKAGTLVELMTEEEANQITHLILQGKLNAVDFRHLRDEFKSLETLDLSTVSIAAYAGKGGTYPGRFYVYPPNCIPAYAFCKQLDDSTFTGKESLRHIILSDKTKNIEDAAFKGCTGLKICEIRKKTPPNLLPQALGDSLTAVFVPLGCSDAYRIKERWEDFAFIESEPVTVKLEIDDTGSLASELVRAGLQPKEVNFLTIKGKVDDNDFLLIRDYMPNLVTVDIAESNATAIPDYTFTQKRFLMDIRLPQHLTKIGQRAFSGCIRLCGTLELPPHVIAIEYGAFMGCTRLKQVMATGNKIAALGDNLFGEGSDVSKLIYQ